MARIEGKYHSKLAGAGRKPANVTNFAAILGHKGA
jgi:hypothetical protein